MPRGTPESTSSPDGTDGSPDGSRNRARVQARRDQGAASGSDDLQIDPGLGRPERFRDTALDHGPVFGSSVLAPKVFKHTLSRTDSKSKQVLISLSLLSRRLPAVYEGGGAVSGVSVADFLHRQENQRHDVFSS